MVDTALLDQAVRNLSKKWAMNSLSAISDHGAITHGIFLAVLEEYHLVQREYVRNIFKRRKGSAAPSPSPS